MAMGRPLGRSDKEIKHNNNEKIKVSDLIAEIIQQTGLSQTEFAKRTGVSLSFITKCFSPTFDKTPSAESLRKIASICPDPEETYKELMNAAGRDITKNPYFIEYLKEEPRRAFKPETETELFLLQSINFHFVNRAYPVQQKDKLFDVVYEFRDHPEVDKWKIVICPTNCFWSDAEMFKNFMWNVLSDGADKRTKYSLVAASNEFNFPIKDFSIPTLDTHISILTKNDIAFNETYCLTANPTPLEGISFNSDYLQSLS